MGSLFSYCNPPKKHKMLDPELEKKIVEAIKQRAKHRNRSFKSINSIIMKFPHFREGLRNIRHVFDRFDENSNGTIDHKELKKCLDTLKIRLTEKEIDDLYHSCDVDGNEGIQYNEFIVLLCIIYLLTSNMELPQLEPIFEPILEAFLFLDKNSDGKLHKKDIVRALNDADGWERSPRHIMSARFGLPVHHDAIVDLWGVTVSSFKLRHTNRMVTHYSAPGSVSEAKPGQPLRSKTPLKRKRAVFQKDYKYANCSDKEK